MANYNMHACELRQLYSYIFSFYMMFTLLSTKRNELRHNLKPTQFAIIVTAWQAKSGSELVLCYVLSVLMLK